MRIAHIRHIKVRMDSSSFHCAHPNSDSIYVYLYKKRKFPTKVLPCRGHRRVYSTNIDYLVKNALEYHIPSIWPMASFEFQQITKRCLKSQLPIFLTYPRQYQECSLAERRSSSFHLAFRFLSFADGIKEKEKVLEKIKRIKFGCIAEERTFYPPPFCQLFFVQMPVASEEYGLFDGMEKCPVTLHAWRLIAMQTLELTMRTFQGKKVSSIIE